MKQVTLKVQAVFYIYQILHYYTTVFVIHSYNTHMLSYMHVHTHQKQWHLRFWS